MTKISAATVQLNKVTGSGRVDYIVQNGIQVSFRRHRDHHGQYRLR